MSRARLPKQMLPLIDDHSMFRTSVERIGTLFSPEDVFVVTSRELVGELQNEVCQIPPENFIIEPYAKNTAPALALALSAIQKRDPEATVAILPADHHILQREKFCRVLEAAWQVAQDDRIVTLGISPSHPATGFGLHPAGRGTRRDRRLQGLSVAPLHRETGYRAGDAVPRFGPIQLEFRHVHLARGPGDARL